MSHSIQVRHIDPHLWKPELWIAEPDCFQLKYWPKLTAMHMQISFVRLEIKPQPRFSSDHFYHLAVSAIADTCFLETCECSFTVVVMATALPSHTQHTAYIQRSTRGRLQLSTVNCRFAETWWGQKVVMDAVLLYHEDLTNNKPSKNAVIHSRVLAIIR